MKRYCVSLLALVLVFGGCASATRITAGPAQVVGYVYLDKEPQGVFVDIGWNRLGFTFGHLGCTIESFVGPWNQVFGFRHSTGNPDKVFTDVPTLE